MQPIIKLRLLTSRLQPYESQQLIQKIGFNKIISLIFNGFVLTYNKTQQHHYEVSNINNIISDIIKSRDKNKSSAEQLTNTITCQINELPFEMIGECASYLNTKDYMNFSLCNRNIYCASNSPIKLHELNLTNYNNYDMINLNRFSMVKGLCIRPIIFNKLQIKIGQFPYLQILYLVNDNDTIDADEDDVNTFIDSKAIAFDQITHLSLAKFGIRGDYDFDSFCNLLIQFPNVTHLELNNIWLTEFKKNNDKIIKITPKLQALHCLSLDPDNNSINLLRNTLLNMYCKHISHLCINFDFDMGIYSFPKLNFLWTAYANDNLAKILSSTPNLKTIEMGDESCKYSKIIQDSLIKSFYSTTSISVLRFLCLDKNEIENITSTVEKILLNAKKINRKTLKIRITLHTEDNIEMTDIELYIKRIINGLDVSQIENIMLIFNFPKEMNKNKHRHKIIERFKLSHLAVTQDRVCDINKYSIIISNKNCKINGYYSRTRTRLGFVKFENDNNIV